MAILITGSRGFIGSHLVLQLKESGYDIISFDGDISDRADILDFQTDKKIDSVIHLASVISNKDAEKFKSINIEGTRNVVDFCKKNKVGHLIFISSIKVLSRLSNPYIDSKREAEKIVIGSGIPYIILRPSMVYGPGDRKNIGFLLRLAKKLPFMPELNFRMQLLYIDDLVKIITESLSLSPNQIVSIAGQTVSYMDLLENAKKLGYNFFIVNWPKFFVLILKMTSRLGLLSMPSWQVDSLLSDEVFEEYGWCEIFNIKETAFEGGLSKTIQ